MQVTKDACRVSFDGINVVDVPANTPLYTYTDSEKNVIRQTTEVITAVVEDDDVPPPVSK